MRNIIWALVIFVAGLIGGFSAALVVFVIAMVDWHGRRQRHVKGRPWGFEFSWSPPNGYTDHQRAVAVRIVRSQMQRQAAYHVLAIPVTATLPEVKAAYRQAMLCFHPDKVRHLTPEQQCVAAASYKEVQEAYAEIKNRRAR